MIEVLWSARFGVAYVDVTTGMGYGAGASRQSRRERVAAWGREARDGDDHGCDVGLDNGG
jgi:hypothetical protein